MKPARKVAVATIPVAASVIAAVISLYFPALPYTAEMQTTGFAVAGGFAGAWFGAYRQPLPRYIEWLNRNVLPLPALGFLSFSCSMGAYLLMWGYIPNPEWWQVVVEMILYGWASFCFFWFIVSAGGDIFSQEEKGE